MKRPARLLYSISGCLLFLIALFSGASGRLQANVPRYADRGDGTILDRETALVWQKCSAGQTYGPRLCSGTALQVDWYAAREQCRQLSLNGGNWRLPSEKELRSIMDFARQGLRIDQSVFAATAPFRYWSVDTRISADGLVGTVVDFADGLVYTEQYDDKNSVRCVSTDRIDYDTGR